MNNQEREEHRLAALAAGYEFRDKYSPALYWRKIDSDTWTTWQPKINKADSFDLMVACALELDVYSQEHIVCFTKQDSTVEGESLGLFAESYMQAIFNCAVAIGRSMEASNEQSED